MRIFVSYARDDDVLVRALVSDLERLHHDVWLDRDLDGGQTWWEIILEQIKSSDVFVAALSPESLVSTACLLELSYAASLNRHLLPVVVRNVEIDVAPDTIHRTQVIDYRERSPESAISLSNALSSMDAPSPLPEPLPDPPPLPLTRMRRLHLEIASPSLAASRQDEIFAELRDMLHENEAVAISLLRQLRACDTVDERLRRVIKTVLDDVAADDEDSVDDPLVDEAEQVDQWVVMLTTLSKQGHCTPILGFDLLAPILGQRHQLIRQWHETFDLPLVGQLDSLAQAAQFLTVEMSREVMVTQLEESLRAIVLERHGASTNDDSASLDQLILAAWDRSVADNPDEPHAVLASLPLPIYVVAHPANVMAHALRRAGKDPVVSVLDWSGELEWPESPFDADVGYVPSVERPLVFHTFGNVENRASLVTSEDDYFDFLTTVLRDRDTVPVYVRAALANTPMLLLGFTFDEWDLRFVLRGLVVLLGDRTRRRRYRHLAQVSLPQHIRSRRRARRYIQRYFEDSGGIELTWTPRKSSWRASAPRGIPSSCH